MSGAVTVLCSLPVCSGGGRGGLGPRTSDSSPFSCFLGLSIERACGHRQAPAELSWVHARRLKILVQIGDEGSIEWSGSDRGETGFAGGERRRGLHERSGASSCDGISSAMKFIGIVGAEALKLFCDSHNLKLQLQSMYIFYIHCQKLENAVTIQTTNRLTYFRLESTRPPVTQPRRGSDWCHGKTIR